MIPWRQTAAFLLFVFFSENLFLFESHAKKVYLNASEWLHVVSPADKLRFREIVRFLPESNEPMNE